MYTGYRIVKEQLNSRERTVTIYVDDEDVTKEFKVPRKATGEVVNEIIMRSLVSDYGEPTIEVTDEVGNSDLYDEEE